MNDTGLIGDVLEAYERLILDAMRGDHTLFTTADGIERLWEVSVPLLEAPPPVRLYQPGSWGPKSIHQLVAPPCLAPAIRAGPGGARRRLRSKPPARRQRALDAVQQSPFKVKSITYLERHSAMPDLFDPLVAGDLHLPNRIVMAPLTRCRAGGRVPNDLMARYYEQRASAGLILSEATSVTPEGVGYPDTPGIWSDAQVEGWKRVTDKVHRAGGRIALQLWHVGRISDPVYLDGQKPVAPSAIAAAGHVSLVRPMKAFETPRALETSELVRVVDAYRRGAVNAKAAGFDGVEIHGANGYLLDQFLQDKTNQRTDAYGGSIENRARLMLEVTDACIDVWGAGRVGMHLAPRRDAHDMGDSTPLETFGHVARELGKRKIAFICAREHLGEDRLGPQLKKDLRGRLHRQREYRQGRRPDGSRCRRGGCCGVRKALHRQPGPAGAVQDGRVPERTPARNLLRARVGRLHRLPSPRGLTSKSQGAFAEWSLLDRVMLYFSSPHLAPEPVATTSMWEQSGYLDDK